MGKRIFSQLPSRRDGVSVIEVLFAMGVVVIGLLGVASLLPLASKNAAESMQFAEAQAFSNDWYSEFSARGMNNSSSWIMYRDFSLGPANPAQKIHFDKQLGATITTRGCVPTSSLTREVGRESVCLDPYFFAVRDVEQPQAANWSSTTSRSQSNWYRPAVFPYYQDTYNPLVDSARAVDPSLAWEAQPRMVRVTLPNSVGGPMSMKNLEQMFLSTDDVALTINDKDRSIAPTRQGTASKFSALNHYSWLATMSPAEPIPALSTDSTNFYTVSLVVVHNRDVSMYDPAIVAPRSGDAQPEDKPQGEQLMWVEPVSGNFVGGSGGRVRLISADGTKEQLNVGGWVMLSRTYAITTVSPGVFRPFTVFRWYRIIAVEQEVEGSLLAAPPLPYQKGEYRQVSETGVTNGNNVDVFGVTVPNNVWGRYVTLEGPDWNFDNVAGYVTPTTATFVKGARAVIERVVNVN